MSADPNAMDPKAVEQTTKNLALASRFVREMLGDPAAIDRAPASGRIVLMPPEDPDLAAANLLLAEGAIDRGEDVQVHRVGVPVPDHPAWEPTVLRTLRMRTLAPRWADDLDPAAARVVYDAGRDVLLLDLAGGRRSGAALPMNDTLLLLVDLETEEAFGNLVVGFLTHAVRRVPRLGQVLAAAELRPLTANELGGFVSSGAEVSERRGDIAPRFADAGIRSIMDDLGLLIA